MIISEDRGRVSEMINSMALDVRNLLRQAIEIAWCSRGSIQYDCALRMTPLERDLVIEFINKKAEEARKNKVPFFM